jgi:hypothetical protein
MRRSCLANMGIARRQEKAHTGCHSCWRLGDLLEAHGRRRSGKAAAATEGSARVVASLLEVAQRTAMHLRVTTVAQNVGRAEGMVEAAAVAVAAAAVVEAVAGTAQAREPA